MAWRERSPVAHAGDGDTVFALATGRWQGQADVTTIGALAAEALSEAIVRAASKPQRLAACRPRAISARAVAFK